jgi:CheY-like chemotaxis protein
VREQYRVLLVEDSISDAFSILGELLRGGLDVEFERVGTAAELEAALEGKTWDLVICGYCLRRLDGAAVLALYRQKGLDIPFIVVSRMGERYAVEMIEAGAHGYVLKDNLAGLVPVVSRELRVAQERRACGQGIVSAGRRGC